jgi:hypothetical protein
MAMDVGRRIQRFYDHNPSVRPRLFTDNDMIFWESGHGGIFCVLCVWRCEVVCCTKTKFV